MLLVEANCQSLLRLGGSAVQWRWREHSDQLLVNDFTQRQQQQQQQQLTAAAAATQGEPHPATVGVDAYVWYITAYNKEGERVHELATREPA